MRLAGTFAVGEEGILRWLEIFGVVFLCLLASTENEAGKYGHVFVTCE
ncbi:hypothetical protein Tco_1308929, partial [Tanacetum coccineum]